MRRRMAVTLSVGGLMLAAPGCHVGRKADLVSKLDLRDALEIVVEYKEVRRDPGSPLRITDSDTVHEILADLANATGAPRKKWATVARCTIRRARGDRVQFNICARHDQEGEVLLFEVGRRYYEVRGTLLSMMQKHVGGTLMWPPTPLTK